MGSFKARLPRPSGIREYSEKNSPVELVAFMDVEMQLFHAMLSRLSASDSVQWQKRWVWDRRDGQQGKHGGEIQ